MNALDWSVLAVTLVFIVTYGTWKTRGANSMQGYFLGNKTLPWWTVCLSIMATQASAITFLSTTGQAYEDGMRFLQFYLGLPLAMIILCVTAVPIYHRMKVFTAYEYLETRFDRKVRTLGACFFLMGRGLAVGITLYAPALILSAVLGWPIQYAVVLIGILVLIYTVTGGTKAVSITQKYQLSIIMAGMVLAGGIAFSRLPDGISFGNTFQLAGELGKMNLINLNFNPQDRYNIWSGLLGGFFLFLSYFGTDQSQVGRYLSGSSIREMRMGLIFNGLLKVPMQFIILYIGILVFIFYQFHQAPLIHNVSLREKAVASGGSAAIMRLESEYNNVFTHRREAAAKMIENIQSRDESRIASSKAEIEDIQDQEQALRMKMKDVVSVYVPGAATKDTDYVFIQFVLNWLPHGVIGLLLAVVFLAAMSSMASELNALSTTSAVDIYKRSIQQGREDGHYVRASRWLTIGWAIVAMTFASFASQAENLIQYVNIVGSLVYGTILGIFLCAFYVPYVRSNAVFWAGLAAECVILYLYFFQRDEVAFLWYNVIGPACVLLFALLLQAFQNKNRPEGKPAGR